MSLGIYQVTHKPIPYDGELEDKEFRFLDAFLSEEDGSYYVDASTLEDIIQDYDDKEMEVPEELIKFLRNKITSEGDFWFIIA